LGQNNAKLDSERLEEWKERKLMHDEFMNLRMHYLEQDAKKEKEMIME